MKRYKRYITQSLYQLCFVLSLLLSQALPAQAAWSPGKLVPWRQDDKEVLAQIEDLKANAPAFSDNFRADNGVWSLGGDKDATQALKTSTLRVTIDAENTVAWTTAEVEVSDFYLEVDAFHVTGSADNQMGVLFRHLDSDNFYLYSISSDGYYALRKLVDGEWEFLAEWAESDTLNTGEESMNSMGVLAQGSQITILANGQIIASFEDDSFTSGTIGLAGGAYAETGVEVAFDELYVWTADGAIEPTAEPTETEEPTPTEEPEPTPTPATVDVEELLMDTRAADPTFADEFRRDEDHWSLDAGEHAAISYNRRALEIQVDEANSMSWSANQTLGEVTSSAFLMEADVTLLAGPPETDIGLLFHLQDGDNFHLFAIRGDGAYSLWRKEGGEWQGLVDWTEDAAIDTEAEATNRIGVLVQGANITLLVNDTVLTQVEDETFAQGFVALSLGANEEASVQAGFDNFSFWEVEAGPPVEPTSEPTPEPEPVDVSARLEEIRQNEATISDQFRRDDGAWPTGESEEVSQQYDRREFHIIVNKPQTLGWSTSEIAVDEFYAEIDAIHVAGAVDVEYGLFFRFVDQDNYYLFAISQLGTYALIKVVDGEYEELVSWAESDAIEIGEEVANRMAVLAEGSQITILVNDIALAQVEDDSHSEGNLGLVVGTFDEGEAEIAFDNLDYWDLTE